MARTGQLSRVLGVGANGFCNTWNRANQIGICSRRGSSTPAGVDTPLLVQRHHLLLHLPVFVLVLLLDPLDLRLDLLHRPHRPGLLQRQREDDETDREVSRMIEIPRPLPSLGGTRCRRRSRGSIPGRLTRAEQSAPSVGPPAVRYRVVAAGMERMATTDPLRWRATAADDAEPADRFRGIFRARRLVTADRPWVGTYQFLVNRRSGRAPRPMALPSRSIIHRPCLQSRPPSPPDQGGAHLVPRLLPIIDVVVSSLQRTRSSACRNRRLIRLRLTALPTPFDTTSPSRGGPGSPVTTTITTSPQRRLVTLLQHSSKAGARTEGKRRSGADPLAALVRAGLEDGAPGTSPHAVAEAMLRFRRRTFGWYVLFMAKQTSQGGEATGYEESGSLCQSPPEARSRAAPRGESPRSTLTPRTDR